MRGKKNTPQLLQIKKIQTSGWVKNVKNWWNFSLNQSKPFRVILNLHIKVIDIENFLKKGVFHPRGKR